MIYRYDGICVCVVLCCVCFRVCAVYVLCLFVAGVMIRSCSSCPRYQSTTDTGEAAENFVGTKLCMKEVGGMFQLLNNGHHYFLFVCLTENLPLTCRSWSRAG